MKSKKIIVLGLAGIIAIGGLTVVSAKELESSNFSFNKAKETAEARQSIYANLPENPTDEQLEEFYSNNNVGEGSAYVDGEYDESAKASYGYNKGKQTNEERKSQFTEEDGNENYSSEGYSYSKGQESYKAWHDTAEFE